MAISEKTKSSGIIINNNTITRFYDYVNKNRLGDVNYEKPYVFPSVNTYSLTSQQIYDYNKKFNKEYFLRPKYILKMAKEINSITKFKTYYDTFLKLMKKAN